MAVTFCLPTLPLGLVLVNFWSNIANANLTIRPTDTVVLVNQTTYFNCSTSAKHKSAEFVLWYHNPLNLPRKDVYDDGKITDDYKDRFRIEINLAEGVFNLVAERPSLTDAGRYICGDVVGHGDAASAELIVLDGNPSCASNMTSDGVIGPNDCGLEPDDIQLTCNVTSYHGNIPPTLEWKMSGDESSSSLVVCNRSNSCNLTLKSTLTFNSQSLVCQTRKARRQQYGCSIGPPKVKYALSSRVKFATKGDVKCYANSSQSCSYKWYNDKNETVSSDANLWKHDPGQYKCEAQCQMNKQHESCRFIAMEVEVVSSDNRWYALLVLLPIAAVGIVVFYLYKRSVRKKNISTGLEISFSDVATTNVPVHAKADVNSPAVKRVEVQIVIQLNCNETDTPQKLSEAMQEFLLYLKNFKFIGAKVGKSIVFFFRCDNLTELKRLQNLIAAKELQKKVEVIYNEFLSTSTKVRVAVTFDDAEFKKAESKLQDHETLFAETDGLLMETEHNGAVNSQFKLPDELLALPIITNQGMVDNLTVNQYFIDRGTSGAIYGPFRWEMKKCVLKQILFSPEQLTKDMVENKDLNHMDENIQEQANRYKELNHPHLVKVFEVWFPLPALYILMEYAEGRSLDKILRPKDALSPLPPFPIEVIRNWALQIADGMKYLHYNNLVHRNLKAAHVLVMDVSAKTLKIGSYKSIKQHDHATIMSVKGTLHWMAPEYIRGEEFEKSSDVWSYGVTVWEILTRELPFNEVRKETDIVRGAINKTLKLKIPDSCPQPLQKLLTDCWNYEVNIRPSFTQICDRLNAHKPWETVNEVCNIATGPLLVKCDQTKVT